MDEKFGENGLPEENVSTSQNENSLDAQDRASNDDAISEVSEQPQTSEMTKQVQSNPVAGGNPFVQSDSDFRKAENDYYNQIKNLESANMTDEDRIRIEQVQADELKKEQEIAEREAKLKLQREELERREQELKERQEAEREQREQEEREKRMAQEAEERKKREQEERLKRLEEEEQYQKQKLAELEAAEQQDQSRELREIVPPDPDKALIQKEKEKQLKDKIHQESKAKKKMPFALKMLIIVGAVAVLLGVGFIVLKNVLSKSEDPNEIVSSEFVMAQDTFYEGDEISNLAGYYIQVKTRGGQTTKVAMDYQMITSDFVLENNGKLYIKMQENLTEEKTVNFSVKYNDIELSKAITIKGVEMLDSIRFNIYADNASFYEYDDVNVVDKLMVYSGKKVLTPYQYKLYIEKNDNSYELLRDPNDEAGKDNFIITMPTLSSVNSTFTMKVSTNTDNPIDEKSTTSTPLTLKLSTVSRIVCELSELKLKSLDFYEQFEGDNTKKDFAKAMQQLRDAKIYAELNTPGKKTLELKPVYQNAGTVYEILCENNQVGFKQLTADIDNRLYYYLDSFNNGNPNESSAVQCDLGNNSISYTSMKLDNSKSKASYFYIKSLSNDSVSKLFAVNTEVDRVVSAKLDGVVTYTGDVNVGDAIVINSTTVPAGLVLDYTLQSGRIIKYDSLNNKVLKIDNDNVEMELGAFTGLQLRITTKDQMGADVTNYRFDSSEHKFGGKTEEETENMIGSKVDIYLTCDCAEDATTKALIYITTTQTLQY